MQALVSMVTRCFQIVSKCSCTAPLAQPFPHSCSVSTRVLPATEHWRHDRNDQLHALQQGSNRRQDLSARTRPMHLLNGWNRASSSTALSDMLSLVFLQICHTDTTTLHHVHGGSLWLMQSDVIQRTVRISAGLPWTGTHDKQHTSC